MKKRKFPTIQMTVGLIFFLMASLNFAFGQSQVRGKKLRVATLQTSTSTSKLPAPPPAETKSFGVATELEYATNNYKEGDLSKETTMGIAIAPSYKLSDRLTISALQIVSKEETGQKITSASNTSFTLAAKGFRFDETSNTRHEFTGIAPVNAVSRDRDKFQGGLRLGNGIEGDLFGIRAKYMFYVLRNFHEFTLNREGSPNIQYSLQHRVDLSIPLFWKLSLDLTGAHRTGYTYRDFNRFNYLVESTLSLAATEKLALFVGTSTDAPATKANGVESNIQLFDENRGQVRSGLSYVF